jgi:hypothetical protein
VFDEAFDEGGPVRRVIARAVTPLVRFVEWMFGSSAPGLDLGLFLFAFGWGSLMLLKPRLFDTGQFVGMQWLPDATWIGFFAMLSVMHGAGFLCPRWRALRVAAGLLSAWIWMSVSGSLLRVEMTTGVLAYAIVGFGALCGSIYVAGLPRHGG